MANPHLPQWQKVEYGNLPQSQRFQVEVPDFVGMVNSFQSANYGSRPEESEYMKQVLNRINELESNQTNQRIYPENTNIASSILNNVTDFSKQIYQPINSKFSGSTQEIQQTMYNRLRTQLNHRDAIAILGNIGAETGWQDRYFFGSHKDGSKQAYGAFSWQGGRETKLLEDLRSKGLLDGNGNIKKNMDVINSQADHILWELNNNEKGNWNRYQKGNYQDILEASRAFNNSVVRSSKDAKILAGRESKYQDMMRQAHIFEKNWMEMNQRNINSNEDYVSTLKFKNN